MEKKTKNSAFFQQNYLINTFKEEKQMCKT